MTRLVRIAQVVLLVALGVFLWDDWRARRVDAERWQRLDRALTELARAAAVTSTPPPTAVTSMIEREALAQRIVGLIRAGMPAPSAPCSETAGSPEPEPEPKTFSADDDAKAREAEQIVSASLATGHLRVEDVMRLRSLELASRGHPDFAGMRTRIFAAVNSQKLVADDLAFVAF